MYFTILDLFRLLSSIAVLFHHTFLFHYGRLGIYLFFMISGFVIYFSLNKGIKEYVTGRLLRLFPIFWVCATITYLITVLYHVNISFKHYLLGLLMFNNGHMEIMIDGSYWTLTFELLFYFYIGVFVWLFGKKRLEWFYIGWLLLCFLCFYFRIDQMMIFKLLSIRFAPYFVFGGMLALLVDKWNTSSYISKVMHVSTLIASWLMPIYVSSRLQAQKDTITNFTGSFDRGELFIVELLFVIMYFAVILSFYDFTKNKTFSKVVFLLGGMTYPLYLLHWKIGKTLIGSYEEYGHVTILSAIVALALVLVSFFLSIYDQKFRTFFKVTFLDQVKV